MICFYHSADLDGHCSGAVIKWKYPDCEMRGWNYGDEFPWTDVEGCDVIMVDICLQPFFEHMPRLNEITKSLVWIDHHKSEIDEYSSWLKDGTMAKTIDGLRDIKKAACELCWEYFYPIGEYAYKYPDVDGSGNHAFQNGEIPTAIKLLGRYDVWDLEADDRIMPFQWGMRLEKDTLPENIEFWERFLWGNDFEVREVVGKGKLILKFRDSENSKYCSGFSFETKFEGLKFICLNRGMTNSQMFDSVFDETKHDAMLTFSWKKGKWTVSMYTTKDLDLSKIAKKYGGGGHQKACGFQCDTNFIEQNILM